MGLQSKTTLKVIVGTLKDKASFLSSAASTSPASAAVLRATTHQPSSEPAPSRHLDALLEFGRGPRPAAASAVAALLSRLRGTRDAAVALKCLLCLHHVARRGSFILRDQLVSAVRQPPSGGGRNPLNLSGFRDGSTPESWTLTGCVRWYARVLEQILSCYCVTGVFLNSGDDRGEEEGEERAASLPNGDLVRETDALVGLLEETRRAPDAVDVVAGSRLVAEVVRLVREDGAAAEKEALVRVREMGERLGCMGFGESVELTCLLRRLEGIRGASEGGGRLWEVAAEVREKAGAALAAKQQEEEELARRVQRREKKAASESARLGDRAELLGSAVPLRFGSTRWSHR